MVITVTLNPALDKTLVIQELALGEVNRVKSHREDLGGSGINVSKVLKELGVDSLALGFLGKNLRARFEEGLDEKNIQHHFIPIGTETRTNIKLVDEANQTFTDFNELGGSVSQGELDQFFDLYQKTVKEKDLVVLSGGVSNGIPHTIYATLTRMAKEKGAMVVVDAVENLLKNALDEKPYAIKPNAGELSALVNRPLKDEDQIIQAAEEIRQQGVEHILVSIGAAGSIYLTKDGVYRAKGLNVPVKGTVGAGDSMVAALVYSILHNKDDLETLALAQGAGAAAVMLEGTQACSLSQVEALAAQAIAAIHKIQ